MLAAMLRPTCSRVAAGVLGARRGARTPASRRTRGPARGRTSRRPRRRARAASSPARRRRGSSTPIAAGRVSARSNACATSSACTWCRTPSPRSGSASGSPVASRRQTSGSRLPAGVMTGQPGPLMWPGCSTTLGTPPATVSRQQQRLDRRLAGAVLAVRGARLVLGHRHARGRAVDPDRPAVQQQRPRRAQRVDELPRRLGREADHVDHHVGAERRDPLAERSRGVLGVAVDGDALDRAPLGRRRGTARARRG